MFTKHGFWYENCCANPEFKITEDEVRMEKKMECLNCNEFYIVIIGMPVIDYWNEMIIERNRKKREVFEVDINLYPYPVAIY